jgi:cyclopropane fatty-acyl-phospholipid synthase-like methyltransferase
MEYINKIINNPLLNFGFDENNYIYYQELSSKNGKRYDYIINNNDDINAYSSHSPSCSTLYEVISKLDITENDSIIDIGSGKGFALVLFSLFNFSNITGIEINAADYDVCVNNLQVLKLEKKINVVKNDCLNFNEFNKYNYFYFYNPFNADLFDKLISNIVDVCNHRIRIIYKNIHHEEETILRKNNFVLIKEILGKDRAYKIYERL